MRDGPAGRDRGRLPSTFHGKGNFVFAISSRTLSIRDKAFPRRGMTMKPVFNLANELAGDPNRIRLTQELTLNAARPEMGLRGDNGLFGSPTWWQNLSNGKIPTLEIVGIIDRTYCAGQGDSGPPNMVDLLTDAGSIEAVGIYVNDKADVALFKPGRRVSVVYALEKLKKQPASDGGVNYSRVAVKMSVSME